ncbi:uncharacterized protein EV420DRAFT_1558645 [Desarmillaria tabescens]|uniref:F-box domain-containing protein n=1 Tax=Armillaria tabescens TaxID=1929756 RepID=A0AA39K1M8_ARMTA|nr:uncharacterized protein EV420DRAFT_1558645 [Desarmillaria tabescens]KAK0452849.1 hypothetical protein EV420DRAFT_1558645 [Desarmillaria tabescens]
MDHVTLDINNINNSIQSRLDRILQLESEISRLRTEVDCSRLSLRKYDFLHAPIRRLPPELLLLIFRELELDGLSFKNRTPLVLMGVCASWRHLVAGTPTLWSTMRMGCSYGWDLHRSLSGSLDVSRTSSLLALTLQYSKAAPLDIILHSGGESSRVEGLTNLLKQHSSRWRSLNTDNGRFIPANLPALEMLVLRDFSTLSSSLQAPRLHTLRIGALYDIPFIRCRRGSVIGELSNTSITSNLLELDLPTQILEILAYISFPVLHTLKLGCGSRDHRPVYSPSDVDILNHLHCPHLGTLIFRDAVRIMSFARLLSYPIACLDLVVTDKSLYDALGSTILPCLEDLRVTHCVKAFEGLLRMVRRTKEKRLRNLDVRSWYYKEIRKLFREEDFHGLRTRFRAMPCRD